MTVLAVTRITGAGAQRFASQMHSVMMYFAVVTTVDDGIETIHDAFAQTTMLMSRYLFDRANLSPTASAVLYLLHAEGPVRLTALAASVDTSQPSMTQLAQRLERRGLVVRSADPDDRRAALVTITDGGRALVLERDVAVRDRLRDAVATLSPHDRDALRLAAHVWLPIVSGLVEAEARRP